MECGEGVGGGWRGEVELKVCFRRPLAGGGGGGGRRAGSEGKSSG